MRKQLMCMLMLLGILLTLSGCRGHLDAQVTEQDPASDVSYVQVLESVEEKILYTGGDAEDSQAMLYDLNDDGVEELLLSYLYGSESVAFEVWTMSDEMPVQLCAVTDMGSSIVSDVSSGNVTPFIARLLCSFLDSLFLATEVSFYYNKIIGALQCKLLGGSSENVGFIHQRTVQADFVHPPESAASHNHGTVGSRIKNLPSKRIL